MMSSCRTTAPTWPCAKHKCEMVSCMLDDELLRWHGEIYTLVVHDQSLVLRATESNK